MSLVARVDLDFHAQSCAQRQVSGHFVDGDLDRQALDYLDPIAGGVLRGKDREAVAGARAEAFDMALQLVIGEGVDLDRRRLSDAQCEAIVDLCADQTRLEMTPVDEFMGHWVI